MKRQIYDDLIIWKNKENRKPLIVDGARQVGKTWILKEFGRNEFDNLVYINCDKVPEMKNLFYDFDTKRLLRAFASLSEETIISGRTLIILDEIQEAPLGITALKYFCEDEPEQCIIAAGSLLRISIHSGTGYPVGKVDEIKMYPMSFEEFLEASGKNNLLKMLRSREWKDISLLSLMFTDLLRQYYYV